MKRQAILVLLVAVVALVLVGIARRATVITPVGDLAIIESDTLLASTGHLDLGPYSRYRWHHPGPLYFFAMAPFYALSGFRTTGLDVGAGTINIVALVLIATILRRRAAAPLAVGLCAFAGLWIWRAADAVANPWNPHVPVLPMMALLVASADAISGTPAILPMVAVMASLAAQTHVGLVPAAAVLGVVAVAGSFLPSGEFQPARPARLRALSITTLVLIVLWLPPLVEQFSNQPGNFTRLWQFFTAESRPGQSLAGAFSVWSDALCGVLRPDFFVAHGMHWQASTFRWSKVLAVMQLIMLGIASARAIRARRMYDAALPALLLLTSLLALWSTTRIVGEVFDHEVFWVSALGAFNLGAIAAFLLSLMAAQTRRSAAGTMVVSTVCGLLVVGGVLTVGRELNEAVSQSRRPELASQAAAGVAEDLRNYLQAQHIDRPLIRIDREIWEMAVGVVLQLQKQGVPVAIEDEWVTMFTPAFAASGHESIEITIAGKNAHVRLMNAGGSPTIAWRDPLFAHVVRRTSAD
jgi:hypothetical protein